MGVGKHVAPVEGCFRRVPEGNLSAERDGGELEHHLGSFASSPVAASPDRQDHGIGASTPWMRNDCFYR
ncbi:hypothetical protein ACFL6M_05005, partial [Candidatus Eisenbacteria bacterium]